MHLASPQLESLRDWWARHGDQLVELRRTYRWPPQLTTEESLRRREEVAVRVRQDAAALARLTRPTVEAVLKWGFNGDASVLDSLTDDEIEGSTGDALSYLRDDQLAEAAEAATRPHGIGISRASKLLALSDEGRFGIYDSRVGRGLADFTVHGRHVVEVPSGRGERGTTTSGPALAQGFAVCTDVLRQLATFAGGGRAGEVLRRPADVEMALFMRGAPTK